MPLIFALVLSFGWTSFAEAKSCGFIPQNYKWSSAEGSRIPLTVSANQFSSAVVAELTAVKLAAGKRLTQHLANAPKRCATEHGRLSEILAKITNGSRDFVEVFRTRPPVLVVICNKRVQRPTARYVGGHYIVAPVSLADLKYKDADIAAIFAHEVAHYSLNHLARLIAKTKSFNFEKASEKRRIVADEKSLHETEADLAGLQFLENAGFQASDLSRALGKSAKLKLQSGKLDSAGREHRSFAQRTELIHQQIEACGLQGG